MKRLIVIAIFMAEFSVAFAGNPLMVIRCRADMRDASAVTAITTPEVLCFDGELNISVDDPACDNPDPALDTIKLTLTRADGVDWVPGDDAVTINDLTNCNLINNTNGVLTILDEVAGERGAFVADADGIIEIQFIRDPTQDTEIVLRNAFATSFAAVGADPQTIVIPACPAVGVGAAIPTMGEWALIALFILILTLGIVGIRQNIQVLTPVKARVKK